tara:strand:- start:2853 stop:4145 length:1293 start_codon:yes stop_codon:yes gene_type:complete
VYSIHWFRRDLRLQDNHGLFKALSSGKPTRLVFIFDEIILGKLKNEKDARVHFIHEQIQKINKKLSNFNASIDVHYGEPKNVWKEIIAANNVSEVHANEDYEPYAIQRDEMIENLLKSKGIPFTLNKDQVIFAKNEVLKKDGTPYTVYTPYSKAWKARLLENPIQSYPSENLLQNLDPNGFNEPISLEKMGFKKSNQHFPESVVPESLIKNYAKTRDIPGMFGTSRLGIHFRFGTISIREKAKRAEALSTKYFNELIWREFYASILYHFPQVVSNAFKPIYDTIQWDNNTDFFEKWTKGQTGYPLVDAGMRELNESGYMHNRSRMLAASFLTKHLLIDWRWGEAYFAEKLLDFDLASNNGGWQWAAGSGVDAAPYFRIFNPYIQHSKFDPKDLYVKKWVHEYDTPNYTEEIVDHQLARNRCLEAYKHALQ